MADILRIGLSGLLAQQRALAATSNNIANATTPGYSRQRVELSERAAERLGGNFIGTGVDATSVRRLTDDILAAQVRSAAAAFSRSDAFAGLASTLDNLLADSETGLNMTLQSFTNAVQDLSNDPASTTHRQVLLSEARNLASRFKTFDQRLSQIDQESSARINATVVEINSLGDSIAEVNRQVLASGSPGSPPADLLDQRDRLLERLAELVSVDTAAQRDGTLTVFIGSGQALVLGTTAAELAMKPGTFNPAEPEIALRGTGGDIVVTPFLTGGALGGALDFRREMLAPTRAAIGRIAVGLVDTVNTMHRNGMDLDGQLGGDLIAAAAPRAFDAATNTGTGTISAALGDVAALEATSYRIAYDGSSYTLTRSDNGQPVPMTGSGTALDPFLADGLELVVGGAAAAGDQFFIQPFDHVPGSLNVLITNPARVAAAAPVRTRAEPANIGDGTISAGQVIDVTDPDLLATTTIEFLDPATYSINGAGSFAYTPGADLTINGARVVISGAPATGDRFTIEANVGGAGDNRNALEIVAALSNGLFEGGTATLQAAVGRLVTEVGAQTAETANRREAQSLLLDQTRQSLESVRGVNLDEEAANLLRYEQMYQAAAQTIAVADTLFNSLLAAIRR
jgi:flagellar hook-associated protein 1 FlgK